MDYELNFKQNKKYIEYAYTYMESEEQRMHERAGYVGPPGFRSPPGTGDKVAIIFGGVLGGVLGLILLILIIMVIITRRQTGNWGLKWW